MMKGENQMKFALKKAFIEVRVKEPINTIEQSKVLNEVAIKLSRLYTNSNIDFTTSIFSMVNNISGYRCNISPNNIVVDSDNPINLEKFNKLVEETFTVFKERDLINPIIRLGYRTFWGREYDNKFDADHAIDNCFNISISPANKFSKKIENPRIGFNTQDGVYSTNYNFSTAIEKKITIVNGIMQEAKEENCILFDADAYLEGDCRYSEFYNHLNNFKNLSSDKALICDSIF